MFNPQTTKDQNNKKVTDYAKRDWSAPRSAASSSRPENRSRGGRAQLRCCRGHLIDPSIFFGESFSPRSGDSFLKGCSSHRPCTFLQYFTFNPSHSPLYLVNCVSQLIICHFFASVASFQFTSLHTHIQWPPRPSLALCAFPAAWLFLVAHLSRLLELALPRPQPPVLLLL